MYRRYLFIFKCFLIEYAYGQLHEYLKTQIIKIKFT